MAPSSGSGSLRGRCRDYGSAHMSLHLVHADQEHAERQGNSFERGHDDAAPEASHLPHGILLASVQCEQVGVWGGPGLMGDL